MKKLKLQKALLAICLALPLTLTTNQAISATEKNIEIIEKKPNDQANNAQQIQQEQLELIANIETHTAALQYYVDKTKPKKFGEEEYKQFLTYYIKNNIGKYLALIIQAKNNLIQFPNDTNLDQTLTSDKIYRMLITNNPNKPNTIYSKSYSIIQEIIPQIQTYFSKLDKSQNDELPAAEKILKEIFTKVDPDNNSSSLSKALNRLSNRFWGAFGYKTEETNNLPALIDTYIKQPEKGQKQPNPEAPSRHILGLLGDIATQLQKEAAAFDKTHVAENRKLEEIANQIRRFFNAYIAANNTNNQTAKEEGKEASELNQSNLSSKSQESDDIKIDDNKDDNIKTNNNEELEINTEEKQEKDVPVVQKNDPIINQSISSIKEDESESNEEEEETHSKRNNSTLNIPLSTISEEKKVENDEENKEDEKSKNDKQIDPENKAGKDEPQKEGKDTQTENKKSYDTDIKAIKQLIQEWTQTKEQINTDKAEKLTQLEKDIEELELKYKNIVKVNEEDDDDNMC